MTTLRVDQSTLETVASQLASIAGEVGGTGDLNGDASPQDLGSADVLAALEEFQAAWSQGLSTVSADARSLAQLLSGAVTAYEAAESSIARDAEAAS